MYYIIIILFPKEKSKKEYVKLSLKEGMEQSEKYNWKTIKQWAV